MPDFQSLEGMPKPKRSEGHPPDAEPRFGRALVDLWHEEGIERDAHFRDADQNGVPGARFYHSSAGACARQIAYAALHLPESDSIDASGHFITRLGQEIHTWAQEALAGAYNPGQVKLEVSVHGDEMGGHVDAVVRTGDPEWVSAIEIKSMGGVGYKIAVGDRSAAKGPSLEHRLQVFLNAKRVNADEAVIVYLARDAIGIKVARAKGIDAMTRVVAEWTYPREVYEPLADAEIARVTKILELVDAGTLPARKVPDLQYKHRPHNHVIQNPTTGAVTVYDLDADGNEQLVDGDTYGLCDYCRWQTTCARTGAHREPVDVLVQIGALADGGHSEH